MPDPRAMNMIEKARDHVRKKGHALAWHPGGRPWSALRLSCKECKREWRVLRSEAPDVDRLIADLNATQREFPTCWERVLADDEDSV